MKTILIVEDSKTQEMLLNSLLVKAGYNVLSAGNGHDALKIAHQQKVDIIISDIRMPNMNGYEVSWNIKNDFSVKHIPVILLSQLSETKDILMGLESLADSYVIKPFEDEELLHNVDFLLNNPLDKQPTDALAVTLDQQEYPIRSNRRQILSFLLSIYDSSIRRNKQLMEVQSQLRLLNTELAERSKQLEESEMRFRSLVQTVPDIIYKIDEEGRIIFVNQGINKLGYEPEDLIGKHFSCLIAPEQIDKISRDKILPKLIGKTEINHDSHPKLFDERRSGKRLTAGLEIRVKLKNSEQCAQGSIKPLNEDFRDMEVNSAGMYQLTVDGDQEVFIGTVGVIRDITERKYTEQVLEIAKQKADAANQAKSEFLSQMSHELRTPLNAILGFSQLLITDDINPLESDQNEALKEIHKAGGHLLDLINEILDLAKIESGKLTLNMEPCNPKQILLESYKIGSVLAKSNDIEFNYQCTIGDTVRINIDMMRLKQILLNLVSNAIKYNRRQGNVNLSCNQKSEQCLRIIITDTGYGLSDDELTKVFQPFYRTSRTKGIDGTGIGLTITKQLVEMMDGKLGVKSELGKGTEFWVDLPVIK